MANRLLAPSLLRVVILVVLPRAHVIRPPTLAVLTAPHVLRSFLQGFQGFGFRLSTNQFAILRSVSGLRTNVFLFLRIGTP